MNSGRVNFPALSALVLLAVVAVALVAGCGSGDSGTTSQPASSGSFDSDRAFADLTHMVDLGPRPAGSPAAAEQAHWLAGQLEDAGVEHVSISPGSLRNVTGVIPGQEDGYVVVGAHTDTKDIPGFVGANDGASGAAVVLQLARQLPNPMPGPSVAIALFDGEESRGSSDFSDDGDRGSDEYVREAASGGNGDSIPPVDQIKAMVLFDMVGDCDLQIPREFYSDEQLYAAFEKAAGGAPFGGVTSGVLDDHTPFQNRGIPAVDLIDFTYGSDKTPGPYWHTTDDTIDKVCPESLGAVGNAALKAIPQLP